MSPNMIKIIGFGSAALVLGALVAGCGQAPSEQDLSDSILVAAKAQPGIDLTQSEAACMSKLIFSANLSETSLEGLTVDFANPTVSASDKDQIKPLVDRAAVECAE